MVLLVVGWKDGNPCLCHGKIHEKCWFHWIFGSLLGRHQIAAKTCLSELRFENLTESFESCITTINHHHTTVFWCIILAKTICWLRFFPLRGGGGAVGGMLGAFKKDTLIDLEFSSPYVTKPMKAFREFSSLRDGFFGYDFGYFWEIVFRGVKISGCRDFVGKRKRCHNAWLNMISPIFF